MSASEIQTVHVRITGAVQGVGFRAWTERSANALGLSGWARNRSDGSVEAVFSGPPDAVAAMLAACREGPTLARVADVLPLDTLAALRGPFRIL